MEKREPKKTPKRIKTSCAIRQRLQFILHAVYDGKITRFARAAGMGQQLTHFSEVVRGAKTPTPRFITTVVHRAGINAEFLLCGTGPIKGPPSDAANATIISETLNSVWPLFDTTNMQFTVVDRPATKSEKTVKAAATEIALAKKIHAARQADKAVILYVTAPYVLAGAGGAIAEMLRKDYVTAVAMTGGAAYRDVELARFGTCSAQPAFLHDLIDINEAAFLAATAGIGYGEALGRWCYPETATRRNSIIATAHELDAPVTVHATVGESPNHWFPAAGAARLGAALGAACYVDLLVFTEQLKQCAGAPGGVFATSSIDGLEFFKNAKAAVERDALVLPLDDVSTHLFIGGEFRLTFSALLTSCDAVYSGNA